MQLFLIRHPRPQVAEGVCYGQTDLALAETPHDVAERLRPLLPAEVPVFSSPLRRCRELAECLHPTPEFDERLLEMYFGEWEMRPWRDIGRQALDAWAADPLDFAPPGGESPARLLARVADFYAELQGRDIDVAVVVAHAGILKAMHGHVRALPAAEWMKLSFEFGSLARL